MQYRYFGDVGDFGKYGLLRVLCGFGGEKQLNLGVVWYLFPNENHNADGKHLGYLRKPRDYSDCDERLFFLLHSLIFDRSGQLILGGRSIKYAETSGALPEATCFYSEPLAFLANQQFESRRNLRNDWYANALAATSAADIIFLDPDNGVQCSKSLISNAGPKYASW